MRWSGNRRNDNVEDRRGITVRKGMRGGIGTGQCNTFEMADL